MGKKWLALILSLIVISGLAGAVSCGGAASTTSTIPTASTTQTSSAGPATGGKAAVTMQNLSFSPSSLTVSQGTVVTWTNEDSAVHTVTSDTGAFESRDIAQGAAFNFTFTDKGTFTYHCAIHPSMRGTIIVE